jgi:glucose/arabinose dehydrogenase
MCTVTSAESLEPRQLLADPGFAKDIVLPNNSAYGDATSMAFAPDGRAFVTTQSGRILVFRDVISASPSDPPPAFTEFARVPTTPGPEAGLLGLALDPNFASNGYVYTYYTYQPTNLPRHNRVTRLTASAANPDVAEPGSETVLFNIDGTAVAQHNGGALHFGPDGKLFVATGDHGNQFGGADADPQRLNTLHGKLLRINPDGSIPTDNPFYNVAQGDNRAIWALGLRNPYTFAFQPTTGRMFINDAGANSWEEINEGAPGANYGWPITGDGPFYPGDVLIQNPRPEHQDLVPPSYFYRGSAIVGGAFYNPPPSREQFPAEYVGDYFFGDYYSGGIQRFDPDANPAIDFSRRHAVRVNLDYDGATLRVTARDLVNGGTASASYAVDIPAIAGETAYVGFTGTGGNSSGAEATVLNWTFTPRGADAPAIDFGAGFDHFGGLDLNGSAWTEAAYRQLVVSGSASPGSVFHTSRVPTAAFSTQFDLRLSSRRGIGIAGGMTLTIQGNDSGALGTGGQGLGYQGIGRSVAIKLDSWAGTYAVAETGLYTDGAAPTTPATDIGPTDRVKSFEVASGVVDLDVGPDGALYALSRGTNNPALTRFRYTDGPRVTAVAVDRSAWSDAFRTSLGRTGSGQSPPGYALPDGTRQADVLPWPGLDRFSLSFDKSIDPATLAAPGALTLHGGDAPISLQFDNYNPSTRTATWSLPHGQSIPAGRWRLALADGVTDVQGRPLDGEWQDNNDTFPSGDGAPGGDFSFRFNVLPGDVNGDGRVSPLDFARARAHLASSLRHPAARSRPYSPAHDLNGDGRVSIADLKLLRRAFFTSLPPSDLLET